MRSHPNYQLPKSVEPILQKLDSDEAQTIKKLLAHDDPEIEHKPLANKPGKDKYRTFFEQAAIGVAEIQTLTGQFLTINQRFCNIVGYSQEEMLAMSFQALTHPEDLQPGLDKMERLCSGEIQEFSMKKRYFHKNGSIVWVNLTISPLWEKDEAPTTHLAVIEDITKRKNLENRLRQAEKMEAIGRLAGGIAHDFNNILAGIIGYAELSREDIPEGSNLDQNINQILKSSNRAKFLVEKILSFSRINKEENSPCHIQPIVKETLQLLQTSLPSTIQLKIELQQDTIGVLANPSKIQEVIMNLCSNSAHAMADSGTIEISCFEKTIESKTTGRLGNIEPGRYSIISVKDYGTGIEEDVLEHVFEPFYTTKSKTQGIGMGLAVVFGIVQDHGGNIIVKTQPNKGTTFDVYLPETQQSIKPQKTNKALVTGGNERILFVDDEQTINKMAKTMLTSLGYSVTVFDNSIRALNFFKAEPTAFDLLITDQIMPAMTGLELSKRVLKIRKEMPIILCTGFSKSINEAKALEVGIKNFTLKPMRKNEIAKTIRHALDDV